MVLRSEGTSHNKDEDEAHSGSGAAPATHVTSGEGARTARTATIVLNGDGSSSSKIHCQIRPLSNYGHFSVPPRSSDLFEEGRIRSRWPDLSDTGSGEIRTTHAHTRTHTQILYSTKRVAGNLPTRKRRPGWVECTSTLQSKSVLLISVVRKAKERPLSASLITGRRGVTNTGERSGWIQPPPQQRHEHPPPSSAHKTAVP